LIRGVPFAGEKDAVTEGWIRIREPGEVPREIALVALIDAWFPSVMPVTTAPRPFGTISFAAHLFEREWSLEEPLYHRSRLIASQQGYFAEVRELFTPRGEICAINQQTMAVIK
jgi:acyl-CoA thioesterase